MASQAPRKRRRVQFSCVECHRRKVRCDRNDPCSRCSAAEIRCVYASDRDGERQALTGDAKDDSTTADIYSTGSSRWLHRARQETPSPPANERRHDGQKSLPHLQNCINETQRDGNASGGWKSLHGIFSKARLLGTSHPIATYRQCDETYPVDFNREFGRPTEFIRSDLLSEAQTLISSCKATARTLKSQQPVPGLSLEDAVRSLPAREICDEFIDCYVRIVESPFRILHIPSFRREYSAFWDKPGKRRPLFVVIVLLVTSIGVHFSDNEASEPLKRYARQWIQMAQNWLSDVRCKHSATISGLQAHCLLILSLQFNRGKPEQMWISQGVLQRTVIYMGLHRDPVHFPDMPFYHVEMQRRLWSTILELDVQVSMDLGMLPTIIDSDTMPASNLGDEAFDETTAICHGEATTSDPSQSSLQNVLQRSLAVRITIARMMNDTFTQPSYECVLQETRKLANIITATETSLASFPAVHRNLFSFLTRRFLLALHRPFAMKSLQDRSYHYSRKVCLDNTLLLLTPDPDHDFDKLLLVSATLFRHIMHHAAIVLCLEIVAQIKEDQSEKKLLQIRQDTRIQLLTKIQPVRAITSKRLRLGETNVKSHVFLEMAISQIEAMEQGIDIAAHVLSAATATAREALEILQSQCLAGERDIGHSSHCLEPDLEPMHRDNLAPFLPTEFGDMGLSIGDMASWIFSDSMHEYPL